MPRLRAEGVRAVSPNGVLGDPAGATAEEGRALLAAARADLAAFVAAWEAAASPTPAAASAARRPRARRRRADGPPAPRPPEARVTRPHVSRRRGRGSSGGRCARPSRGVASGSRS